MLKYVRTAGTVVLVTLMLLFGFLVAAAGYRTLLNWPSISAALAAYGVIWFAIGPAMLVSGLWTLGSRGRNRIPLWIGGAAAILSGATLIAGVLTYVIPCSGPE